MAMELATYKVFYVVLQKYFRRYKLYTYIPLLYTLSGIISKLDHLKEMGVDGTWLSPIFVSPMKDFGYDISNYYAIQPEYGTMDDAVELFQKAKELKIRIILDFVPNHTSDQCEWFLLSAANDPWYRDYYVWHDGIEENGVRRPPNNWVRNIYINY